MPKPEPDTECFRMATEIVKSALGTQGQWVGSADKVAALFETVVYKIADLRFSPRE
jgi:hypothetical protein